MPEFYKNRIIKLLKRPDYGPLKPVKLARALGVSDQDYEQFKTALDQLLQAGHVLAGSGRAVTLPPLPNKLTGTFRANPRGFGFVSPLEHNAHGDLFIPPEAAGDAMNGDIVTAKVTRKGMRGGQMRYSGRIIEILERASNRFVGTLARQNNMWIVQPDGSDCLEPITVDDVAVKGAREKDKVVVELISYPTERHLAHGVIVEVLGRTGRYETETLAVIRRHHLPEVFDDECAEQCSQIAADFGPRLQDEKTEKYPGRRSLAGETIVTIDPPESQDFDDAISLVKTKDGGWLLGVHIADVSCFVPESSPLDEEAKNRGNSVYLPGKTIPMLPEVLSNGLCSLQPNRNRFCKSAFLNYDREGTRLKAHFENTVIRSTRRLTYQKADKILKGSTRGIEPGVVELVRNMEKLSRAIEKRRRAAGMIHLDLPETELIMDKAGRVVDARPADDSYPHTIIEMFMVEANEAVASFLDRRSAPFVRRIHGEPDALTLENLAKLVRAFGYNLKKPYDRAAIQRLLAAVRGTDCSAAINMAVLRSFEKAEYSPSNVGHYALASRHYCHFTSPIRRYADLMVHRVLENCVAGRKTPEAGEGPDLVETGKHISFTEQRAEDAERELKTILILRMLSGRIGDELDCVVSGLVPFGVFAQCKKFGIEGLIQLEDLGPDKWQLNRQAQCICGVNTGAVVRLGQAIRVCIASVNVAARHLNLVPVKPLAGKDRRGGRRSRR